MAYTDADYAADLAEFERRTGVKIGRRSTGPEGHGQPKPDIGYIKPQSSGTASRYTDAQYESDLQAFEKAIGRSFFGRPPPWKRGVETYSKSAEERERAILANLGLRPSPGQLRTWAVGRSR